jgi:tRNA threonylcarbamoyladenosine biosynthesis protein TsaE
MQTNKFYTADEDQLMDLAKKLAIHCESPLVIYLKGELGAGKTTFVRGFLRGLGYKDIVKSPTYNWVESYQLKDQQIFHFDFFRANNPEELESIGLRDYFAKDAILLIEWPEKGLSQLPNPDLEIAITIENKGREISVKSLTPGGEKILEKLS